jgi:hypothetical protein
MSSKASLSRGVPHAFRNRYKPALNYGYSLATREPFRSSPWSAVEVDARRLWERKTPAPGIRTKL